MDSNYPDWKKWIWRFVRSGLAGGLGSVISLNLVLKLDLSDVQTYTMATAAAFISGFISAGALALRDTLSQEDKSSAINKLPL
jgi:putative flippase GtrA